MMLGMGFPEMTILLVYMLPAIAAIVVAVLGLKWLHDAKKALERNSAQLDCMGRGGGAERVRPNDQSKGTYE